MAGQKEDAGLAKLKMKKGWEKVTQVGQSIPMTLFMMWMTGNNVQIFSIMITVMTLYNAVVGFTSVNAGFEKLEGAGVNLTPQKIAFAFLQLVVICIVLWKCQGMGLLPTSTSDWLSFMPPKFNLETSLPAILIP